MFFFVFVLFFCINNHTCHITYIIIIIIITYNRIRTQSWYRGLFQGCVVRGMHCT